MKRGARQVGFIRMRVLVTGGAGYIGGVASDLLLKAGHDVVVFDNLSQGHRAAVPAKAEFVKGDLACANDVRALFSTRRIDAILHFAGNTLVGESMQKPFLYLNQNVVNGVNLFQTAAEFDVRKIVFSSTSNLFERVEKLPIDESAAVEPCSPYGESKWILERMQIGRAHV